MRDYNNFSPLCGSEIFLASYPSVIFDYPADKIVCHILIMILSIVERKKCTY